MISADRPPAAFFDQRATAYDRAYDQRGSDGHALRARMEVALRLAGSGPGDALDAGMGPGRLLGELASRGWTVSGVDAAEAMVEVARRRLPDAASRLRRAEIAALPFAAASFDVVLATGVLEYTDLGSALAEFARVVRPGGRVVLSYVNAHAFYGLWRTRVFYRAVRAMRWVAGRPPTVQPRGLPLISPMQFCDLLTKTGLEPDASVHTSFLAIPSPFDMLLPGAAERLGKHLEGSGPRISAIFSTQIVFSARKR